LTTLFRTVAYEYSLSHVRSLSPTSSVAQEAAVDIIATALRLPFIFGFDPLFKLDAVIAAKDHEIFSLLQIFLNDGLSEFRAWHETHPDVLEKYSMLSLLLNISSHSSPLKLYPDLEKTQLEHKIRLLTFASLGFKHVGQDLPYSKVAETLQVDVAEVEKWAIDGMNKHSASWGYVYPSLYSHPGRPGLGKTITNDTELAHHTGDGADVREGTVGSSGEATGGMEDRPG
jgi:hypothetical protein